MRVVGIGIVLTIALGVAAWEFLWRTDHIPAGAIAAAGPYVAQVRNLPEGSVAPYGHGVFVRRAGLPLWATSTLVFAGYCRLGAELAWRSSRELVVHCSAVGARPKLQPAPAGVVVTLVGGR